MCTRRHETSITRLYLLHQLLPHCQMLYFFFSAVYSLNAILLPRVTLLMTTVGQPSLHDRHPRHPSMPLVQTAPNVDIAFPSRPFVRLPAISSFGPALFRNRLFFFTYHRGPDTSGFIQYQFQAVAADSACTSTRKRVQHVAKLHKQWMTSASCPFSKKMSSPFSSHDGEAN